MSWYTTSHRCIFCLCNMYSNIVCNILLLNLQCSTPILSCTPTVSKSCGRFCRSHRGFSDFIFSMANGVSRGSQIPQRFRRTFRVENGCSRSEQEVDYLQLSREAMERVRRLAPSLHLNQAQCKLLEEALREAIQSATEHVRGLDPSSVRLFAPAFKELCRVVGDCEKLVRDCCTKTWLVRAILLADSRQEFTLRVSELKWCTKAWRTIAAHGLQGRAWLKRFHKSSRISVADRSGNMGDETARLERAFEDDLVRLQATLAEMQGNVDEAEEVRELAGYVLSRCEIFGADRPRERSKYELPTSCRIATMENYGRILGRGAYGTVYSSSWFQEDFACKVVHGYGKDSWNVEKEIAVLTMMCGHPRIVRLLGVLRSYPEPKDDALIMELMPSNLVQFMSERKRMWGGALSNGDGPFPLGVAVDVMLQVAEGVDALHKAKLFHRDVKPHNVLVEPVEEPALRDEGYVRVRLADFGLTEARSRTFGVQSTGTTKYRAPELGSGSDSVNVFAGKTDTFSFATFCFEVLSGDFFSPELPLSTYWSYVQQGGRPELSAALPSQLASLVRRCWDQDSTKRPAFPAICKELRYLKFLITIGGEMQFRALDVPDEDELMMAEIVKHLHWIDYHELRFVEHKGSGGFGSVDEYKWRDQRVAVKNLFRVGKADVEKEAALLKKVEHPNVVKLIGCVFNDDREGKGMIVMELMDKDLYHLIQESKKEPSPDGAPFPLSVALEIMLKVATAMKHVRDCNVLHRDLKTTNILVSMRPSPSSQRPVTEAGTQYDVKLADFGLSKYKSGNTSFTTRLSEAQYWQAPETSEPLNYSWPADVFSFGVVCYEIVCGERPFSRMAGAEVWKSFCDGKQPEVPCYCPSSVTELVHSCLASDPGKRPNFAEVCTKLEACINAT